MMAVPGSAYGGRSSWRQNRRSLPPRRLPESGQSAVVARANLRSLATVARNVACAAKFGARRQHKGGNEGNRGGLVASSCRIYGRFRALLTHPWVGSTASIGRFWAAADAAGRSLTCPLPAQRVHRGSRVKGGRRPSQRDALAPLTREGCTRRRRGPDLHARMGTQSRCSEIDPRKRHKRWEWALARPLAGG